MDDDQLMLTTTLPTDKGSIWSTATNPNLDWEVEFALHVSGKGKYGGGGMAFWYTKKPTVVGSAFGGGALGWEGNGLLTKGFKNLIT